MKKTFYFNVPNKKPDRQLEYIRYQVKKYLARERRKSLPENVDFWDFDCKIGLHEKQALPIKVFEINNHINKYSLEKKDSFYLEILAKHGKKDKKN